MQICDRRNLQLVALVRSDIRRVMGDMLNDAAMDTYLSLLCTANRQYKVEFLPSCFASFINSNVPKPPEDTELSRDQLFHRIRNYELFTSDVLVSSIITGGHITAVIADQRNDEIVHPDSAGTRNQTYAWDLRNLLQEHWNWRVELGRPESGPYTISDRWKCRGSRIEHTPQQRDNTSCGIFALAFATLTVLQI